MLGRSFALLNPTTAQEQAILALAEVPLTQEMLEFLVDLSRGATLGSGSHTSTAIVALGLLGHPRAAERLVEIVSSGSS
jgi:hypothetical protein